jgi:hypothetical protein
MSMLPVGEATCTGHDVPVNAGIRGLLEKPSEIVALPCRIATLQSHFLPLLVANTAHRALLPEPIFALPLAV